MKASIVKHLLWKYFFGSPGNLLDLFLAAKRLLPLPAAESALSWAGPLASTLLRSRAKWGCVAEETSTTRVMPGAGHDLCWRGKLLVGQALEKRWASWWVTSWPGASQQWGPAVSQVALGWVFLAGTERWPFLLGCGPTSGVLGPVLGFLATRETRTWWGKSSKRPWGWLGSGAPVVRGEAESWDCSAWARLRKDLARVYKCMMEPE